MKLTGLSSEDKKRIHWIYQHIYDREAFLFALVDSVTIALKQKNMKQIKETLETWEASAEIDSIPGAKKRIWKSYNQYKGEKKISKNWEGFKRRIGIA